MRTLNYLFTITVVSLILTSCNEKHNLIAEFDGIENDTIFVEYGTVAEFFSGNPPKRDTVYAQHGKFVYDLPNQEPHFVYFHPKSSLFKRLNGQHFYANQNYIVTLIEPNDRINVVGKLNKYYVDYKATGSVFNEEYSDLRNSYIQESSRGAELELKIDSLSTDKANSEIVNKLFQERNSLNRLYKEAELKYIEDNPKKNISAFFLTKQNSKNFYKHYSGLPIEVKHGIFQVGLNAKIERINKSEKVNDAKSKVIEGTSAPDFNLLSINGENVALMSISNKYVVLDFWGSWCPPCIKGFPKMKEYYSKYKDEVEFIGIACNDTDEKWKKTVEKHNLPWLQLFNTTELEKDVSIKYGIQSYPTKIILDKEKNIVGIFIGESKKFYTKLDSILQ